MTKPDSLSRSELKRLRTLLEQDWPGIEAAIAELEKELVNDGVKDAKALVTTAVQHGLAGYRNSIYYVNFLGKMSDPVRLASFVSYLLDALIKLLVDAERGACVVHAATNNEDTPENRKSLYELFIDGAIRKTLRENGYEQKILVGGSDSLFHSDAGSGDIYAYGLGG